MRRNGRLMLRSGLERMESNQKTVSTLFLMHLLYFFFVLLSAYQGGKYFGKRNLPASGEMKNLVQE